MARLVIRCFIVVFASLLWALHANAAVTVWQIVPKDSSLSFSAVQNNAPVTGKFNQFSGDIKFDPDQLNNSSVHIVVDTASVATSYQEVADTLKTADWLDAKLFPQAIFTADSFTKVGDKTYTAVGKLTLRDKTLPLTLTFVLDDYSETTAHATGSAKLKRTAFGIGKGDWAKTDSVKDEVQINFVLAATKKSQT